MNGASEKCFAKTNMKISLVREGNEVYISCCVCRNYGPGYAVCLFVYFALRLCPYDSLYHYIYYVVHCVCG